ncbi:IS21 family transposase [Mycobacterium avium]|nr:IS21 family transposase [Mycobacterium avium]
MDWPQLTVITCVPDGPDRVVTKVGVWRVRSKVEQFAVIRRDHRVEGLSIRALADKHRVHRRTVRQALASAVPPARKVPARVAPRLEPFRAAIDEMLRSDLDAPKKQRHTARRVLARLVDERDAAGLSYSTVRDHVRKRRPQIAAEAGRALEAGFVPQTYRPGAEAEVDFHDLWVVLAGVKTTTALFTMRLSFSGRAAHRAFATQGQEAFLEGHVYGFDRLGGVPVDKIRYDNLNSAVKQVLFGRSRQESERWVAFRSHYGFEAWYCQPGHEGSHEKGGVEGEGGRFRRTHCVPMPVVESIDELNEMLAAADDADDRRRIANRTNTVGQDWQTEKLVLQPITDEPFDTALSLTPRVDRYAQIMVRCNQYSVPARFIGHRLRVKLSASHVTVYDRTSVVARHPRAVGKGTKVLELDHYLEILARKPGALPGATALLQARAAKVFTAEHDAWWAAARRIHGDAAGTRALVAVLLLHRHLDHADVLAGIAAALSIGATNADVVALEARKAAEHRRGGSLTDSVGGPGGQVLVLAEHRLLDTRALPSVDQYDALLGWETS